MRFLILLLLVTGCANHPVDCALGFVHADCLPGTMGYDRLVQGAPVWTPPVYTAQPPAPPPQQVQQQPYQPTNITCQTYGNTTNCRDAGGFRLDPNAFR